MKKKVKASPLQEAVYLTLQVIQKEGWVSREFLRKELGGEIFDKVEALIKNSTSITRITKGEPPRDGYQWSEKKKMTKKDVTELMDDIGLPVISTPKEAPWKDYTEVKFTMTLLEASLAGQPDPQDPSGGKCIFRRDNGKIVLTAGNLRGMFSRAISLNGNLPMYAKDKILWENILLDCKNTYLQRCIAPGGRGFSFHESIPAGTKIPVTAVVPLSRISVPEFLELIAKAGKYIGFSQAKANQGWGRFRIEQ